MNAPFPNPKPGNAPYRSDTGHYCPSCDEIATLADDGRCMGCDTILDVEAYRHWFWTDAPIAFSRPSIEWDLTR